VAELLPTGAPAASFPWATFGVNITGALLLGFVLVLVLEHLPPSRLTRPFVATGLLGTYTTYSAFALETVQLVDEGRPGLGVAYVAASVTGGLVAAWAGMTAAQLVTDRPGQA
jgi:CrcB protein